MRTGLIFLLSAVITAILAVGSLVMFRDPLPPLIIAILSFPLWIVSFSVATHRFTGSVDILQLQQYSSIEQIRRNTNK